MKKSLLHNVLALAFAASLAACSAQQTQQALQDLEGAGSVLAKIAGVAVAVECSAAPSTAATDTGEVINIVAPDSASAEQAAQDLADNAAIAKILCPLYTSIIATVGTPSGASSNIVVSDNVSDKLKDSSSPAQSSCSIVSQNPFKFVCTK